MNQQQLVEGLHTIVIFLLGSFVAALLLAIVFIRETLAAKGQIMVASKHLDAMAKEMRADLEEKMESLEMEERLMAVARGEEDKDSKYTSKKPS